MPLDEGVAAQRAVLGGEGASVGEELRSERLQVERLEGADDAVGRAWLRARVRVTVRVRLALELGFGLRFGLGLVRAVGIAVLVDGAVDVPG